MSKELEKLETEADRLLEIREKGLMGSGDIVKEPKIPHKCKFPANRLSDEWRLGTQWKCNACSRTYVLKQETLLKSKDYYNGNKYLQTRGWKLTALSLPKPKYAKWQGPAVVAAPASFGWLTILTQSFGTIESSWPNDALLIFAIVLQLVTVALFFIGLYYKTNPKTSGFDHKVMTWNASYTSWDREKDDFDKSDE